MSIERLEVSEQLGSVSIRVTESSSAVATLVLAHGAGAGMDHPFMSSLANNLTKNGINTVRFNFPYVENKKKRPDPPAIAERTVKEVVQYSRKRLPGLPLFAGGKSFGGRMTSQMLSRESSDFVEGVVFFGFPLHAPGKPSVERASHLNELKLPMLFLQGTRDALAEWDLISSVCSGLKTTTLVKFEGADHGFRISRSYATAELASAASEWMAKIAGSEG